MLTLHAEQFYQDSWLILVDAIASLIDQDSDVIFDALDRKEDLKTPNRTQGRSLEINYRNEPVAFFFVLFGIAFEALIARPKTETQNASDQNLEILLALKKILRPSVAGHAIYQDVIFSETMDVFDRLAQTEGLATQAAIVDVVRSLCLDHPSVEAEASDEHLSDDIEQLFELTRIIVLVLAGVLPNLGEKPTMLRHLLSNEAVALVTLSLDALVDVADVFPSVIRADLHACIFHIFTIILATRVCQTVVIPKALPILRRFIQGLAEDASANPTLPEQMRICLQRLRSILANAQRRETDASLQCARNTIMAAAILLSNGLDGISPDEPLVTLLLDDILDCLPDLGLGKVAAGCLRSLLLLVGQHDAAQRISSFLLPRLVFFVVDGAQADPDNARPVVVQALVTLLATLRGPSFATALCMVLPALLYRAKAVGRSAYGETAGRLLAVAARDQPAFKGVAAAMSVEHRSLLEEVLREGGASARQAGRTGPETEEPSIALKLYFT